MMETTGTFSSGEGYLSRMALNDNKAGMEGLNRDKINKIIMDSSKGSRFYENELKKEHQVNQRIDKMLQQKAHITEQQLSKAQSQVEKMTLDLERDRDLSRVIVHVDMDAFYAAVEMRDCPELKNKPMAVGSMSMLSTSNYQARKFGVRAAMPGFIAKKLCPNLAIVPLNFDKYRAVSAEIREIFADYDPNFLPMSLDEAYLDITEHLEQRKVLPEALRTYCLRLHPISGGKDGVEKQDGDFQEPIEADNLSPLLFDESPNSSPCLQDASWGGAGRDVEVFGTSAEEAVRELRFRIEQKTSLTASAGIAPNLMLAKVCSDKNKPNGQYLLASTRQAVMDFIQNLPVRKVSGIGKVTEKMLGALGVTSCTHLGQEMAQLSLLFSETSWHQFLHISLGLGPTHIQRNGERKSMSMERTFGEMSELDEQVSLCRELCQDLAQEMQKEALKGKTVTLKLKNVNFEVKTRAWTMPCAIATTEELFAVAKDLLKTEIENVSPQLLRLRLMGVRVSGFVSVDDKKPLQRSIVGFLQPGRSDSSSSSQMPSLKPVNENQPEPADQTQLPACSSVVQASQQECQPWMPSRGEVEVGRPGPQQTSFFQRVHAQRLLLQAERMASPENGHRTSFQTQLDPTTSIIDPKDRQSWTKKHSDQTMGSAIEGRSTSLCSDTEADSLRCPVCFRVVNTTDLTVFNTHIDLCLSGHPTETNNQPDLVRGPGVWDREEEVKKDTEDTVNLRLDSGTGDHTAVLPLDEHSTANISLNSGDLNSVCLNAGGVSIPRRPDANAVKGSAQCEPRVQVPSGCRQSLTTLKLDSHGHRGPVLTCPVCQVTQECDNLSLFNRHVDLCLNQEVLLELRGSGSFDRPATSSQSAAHEDHGQPLQTAAHRGKSRRRGSSPQRPSKKPKALGTAKNTIDKFFRSNT